MLIQRVAHFIAEQQLFTTEDKLVLAVSGGMDSMVLWKVLQDLGYQVSIAHCNFKLRGVESDEDEAFVRDQAIISNTLYHIQDFPVNKEDAKDLGMSIQELARSYRYTFFDDLLELEDYDYVLTAHHLDDRLETFLLNFTRGAGIQGLASLRPSIERIRRPLLGVNRAEIQAFQHKHNIAYREDSSNASDKYRRNKFRHEILPFLYESTPGLEAIARRNFNLLEQQAYLLEETIFKYRKELLLPNPSGTYILLYRRIADHPARQAIITALLSDFGFTAEHSRQVFEAANGAILRSDNYELLLNEKEAVLRELDDEFRPKQVQYWSSDSPKLALLDSDEVFTYRQAELPSPIPQDLNQAWVDAAELQWPLTIRYWESGDRFCPLGMKGQMQKLQDFFVNNKIDRFDRISKPLLVNGDGRIIWIAGIRLDDRFKLKSSTIEVVCFQFSGN